MSKNKSKTENANEKEETKFHGSVSVTKISADDKEAKRRMRMVELLSAIAVFLVLSVGITLTIIGSVCHKPVKAFFKSMETGEVKYFEESMGDDLTDAVDQQLVDMQYYEIYSELMNINNIDDFLSLTVTDLNKKATEKYGDNLEISVKFKEKKKMSKKEVKDLSDDFINGGLTNVNFSKGYVLSVKVSYKGSLLKESEVLKMNVVKNNKSWICPDVVTNYL